MLLNPLSVYTTNLQDNWYEDGKEKEGEEEKEEEEEEGEEEGETVRRTRVDTSRDPRCRREEEDGAKVGMVFMKKRRKGGKEKEGETKTS